MKLKAVLLTLTIISLVSVQVYAQAEAVGIKGGLNSARLTGFTGNNRISGHVGFYMNKRIGTGWHIQPEIIYSGEGQRYLSDGEERTLALDYIQIPLMFQYYPARQLYFEFGPQLGILASARDRGIDGHFNAKNDFTPTQIGLNVGVGVKANSNIGFYGRYNFGLTDVSRFDDIVDNSRVGQIGMTIRFR